MTNRPDHPPPTASPAPLLAVAGITKAFPGVLALNEVSFDVRAGEIHGLVGENGAGKSTLLRILSGVYRPDAGTIELRGEPVRIESPADARRRGISMVYQDTRLVPDLDVAQNIWLGREPTRGPGLVDRAAMDAGATEALRRLGMPLDPRRPVGGLTVSERQIVEIARALVARARILILDEPTSALDPGEVERLFAILRDLRDHGTGIVFVSHRLPEVLALTDRVTVLKDGELVGTVPTETATAERLVGMMVGEREVAVAFPPRGGETGPPRLQVQNLGSPGHFRDVAFEVAAGEIVGLGGIEGEGQREIARALFGLLPTSGEILLDGKPVRIRTPEEAIGQGIVYLSNDRRGEALLLPHSVRENVALPHLAEWSRLGVTDRARERDAVTGTIEQLRIRTPSQERPVELLSGGNQQKVVVGRWLQARPRVYVFDEPTQGVDVGSKLDLYRLIRGLANDGAAVVVLSADVIELLGLSDRVLVVADGRIVDTVAADEATQERVIGSAVTAERGIAGSVRRHGRSPRAGGGGGPAFRWSGALLVVLLTLLLGAFTARASPYFLTPVNLSDLAIQIVPLALVAFGQTLVVLLGGVDLSVGPLVSLTTAVASYLIVAEAPGPILLGVAAALAVGAAVGALNGALIVLLRIPDLIATLATYSIVFGAALVVRPAPGGLVSFPFMDAVTLRLGYVPAAAAATLVLYVVGEIALGRTRLGTAIYATGSSREGAYVAGIPVDRVRFGAYVVCALTATLAGLVLAARIGSGDPQVGTNFTLASITAVVIGGASIFGGRGTLLGALAGCVLVLAMQNALNLLQISAYYQYVWTGVLTLLAVAIYTVRDRLGPIRRLGRPRLAAPAAGD